MDPEGLIAVAWMYFDSFQCGVKDYLLDQLAEVEIDMGFRLEREPLVIPNREAEPVNRLLDGLD